MAYCAKTGLIIFDEDWIYRPGKGFRTASEVNLSANPACIFCEIISGHSEASIVSGDDLVTVFMDIHPVNPGHLLVVPNQHVSSLADVPENVCARMFVVGRRMARALRRSGLRCEGINLFLADGAVAGQDVFHSHLHVIPRFQGNRGKLRLQADSLATASREELDVYAEAIRNSLNPAGEAA